MSRVCAPRPLNRGDVPFPHDSDFGVEDNSQLSRRLPSFGIKKTAGYGYSLHMY